MCYLTVAMSEELRLQAQDDGLFYGEVGRWAEEKHALVGIYNRLFSTGMKNKWETRVYIELYAGPGLLKIRNTNKFIWGSPILALDLPDPFNTYVFCESDEGSMNALKKRVTSRSPSANVRFVQGNCDQRIDDILTQIPRGSVSHRVLSSCFADPFDLSLKFSTVTKLAGRRVDFLILLALHMDGNRAKNYYLDPNNRKVDEFLGLSDWRERWHRTDEPKDFPRFLAEAYAKQMESLGYLPVGLSDMKQIRSGEKNSPLYHLALF